MTTRNQIALVVLAAAAMLVGCHTNPKLRSTSPASINDIPPSLRTSIAKENKVDSVEKLEYNGPSVLYRVNYTTPTGEKKSLDINPDLTPPSSATGMTGTK